jgi:hypothetical protein
LLCSSVATNIFKFTSYFRKIISYFKLEMTNKSLPLVIVFSILTFIFFVSSLSILGYYDSNPYKTNKKLYALPAITILFFLGALFSGLACTCNWASSSFCGNNNTTSPPVPITPTPPPGPVSPSAEPTPPPGPVSPSAEPTPPPGPVSPTAAPLDCTAEVTTTQDGKKINATTDNNIVLGTCSFNDANCAAEAWNMGFFTDWERGADFNFADFNKSCDEARSALVSMFQNCGGTVSGNCY